MVRKEPVALLSCGLPDETELDHVLQGFRDSRGRERNVLGSRRNSDNWLPLKVLMDTQN